MWHVLITLLKLRPKTLTVCQLRASPEPAIFCTRLTFTPNCRCTPPRQIWVKPSAEMQFLYGNNVLKSGLGRITENTPAYTGVVIYSMSDIPLGFGVTGKSTNDCRTMDPSGIVAFHQADVGEYLRAEDDI